MKTKRARPIHVLMIDDEEGLAREIVTLATEYQILIKNFTNLEEGFNELSKSKKYQFLILDGKAYLTPDQAFGTEKPNFVFKGIQKLQKLEASQKRVIPFCVLTAYYGQLEDSLENLATVFNKKKPGILEEMFYHIKKSVRKQPETELLNRYPDVFKVISKHFPEKSLDSFFEILSDINLNSKDFHEQLETMGTLRRLNEKLCDILCENYLLSTVNSFVPKKLQGKRTLYILEEINKRKQVPGFIYNSVRNIYYTSSKYASHNLPDEINELYIPSSYTVRSMTFGLLESILWADKLIESKRYVG